MRSPGSCSFECSRQLEKNRLRTAPERWMWVVSWSIMTRPICLILSPRQKLVEWNKFRIFLFALGQSKVASVRPRDIYSSESHQLRCFVVHAELLICGRMITLKDPGSIVLERCNVIPRYRQTLH